MNFWTNPFFLIAASSGAASLVAIYFACRASKKVVRTVCALAAWIFLWPALLIYAVFHPGLIDPRYSVYQKLYEDIHMGMTRQEVFAAMDRRYPAGGPRLRPTVMEDTPEFLGFFMNPEPPEREPNCEGIFLSMREGRVVKKAYGED